MFGGATDGSYRRGIAGGKIGVGRDDASFFDLGGWTTFQGLMSRRWFAKRPLGLLLPAVQKVR